MSRDSLGCARSNKRDEFRTLYEDVRTELRHYIEQFRGKTICCPCDPPNSNFARFFHRLERLGIIKRLIRTSIDEGVDFLGKQAIINYKKSDIIVTNPPFSRFREFVELLDRLDKKFIIWGNSNALTYKPVVDMVVKGRIRPGYMRNKTCTFEVPDNYGGLNKVWEENDRFYCRVPSCSVFTNMEVPEQQAGFGRNGSSSELKRYDNLPALNVNRVKDIPLDYKGVIGVPITYFYVHDPDLYNIIGLFNNFDSDHEHGLYCGSEVKLPKPPYRTRGPVVDGQAVYARFLIRRK